MTLLLIGLKFILYASAIFGSGIALLRAIAPDFRSANRPLLLILFGTAVVLASMAHYLFGAWDLAGGVAGLTDPFIHEILLETPRAKSDIAFGLTGVLILVAYGVRAIGIAAIVTLAFAVGSIGHTAALGPLGQIAVALHVAIIAFWAGGLALISQAKADHCATVAANFGRIALIAVPIALACGVGLSIFLVGGVQAFVTTDYGRVLMLKVLLVGAVLWGAAANQRYHTDTALNGNPAPLRRSVRIETIVFLGVLLVTAFLTQLTPPAN